MKINKKKTKVIIVCCKNGQEQPLDINLGTGKLEEVKEFFYLGSEITKDERSKNDKIWNSNS